ncbi:MAG TPA: hypothetical protein VKX17_10645, partial [Planctomycetota bacterium]|nr:hypothetical protein [Planctomycetota bacterium]
GIPTRLTRRAEKSPSALHRRNRTTATDFLRYHFDSYESPTRSISAHIVALLHILTGEIAKSQEAQLSRKFLHVLNSNRDKVLRVKMTVKK